jgi:hypothetical protein
MAHVLFIHGTMTRYDEDYLRTFAKISRRLHAWRGKTVVRKFPWGEYWGAELKPRFVAIPGMDERADEALVLADDSGQREPATLPAATLWALLYDEPLAELQLLLDAPVSARAAAQSDAGLALRRAAHQLAAQPAEPGLAQVLSEAELLDTFGPAASEVAGLFQQGALRPALQALPDARKQAVRAALARASVAIAMVAAQRGGSYPEAFLDAQLRDRAVQAVDEALGGGAVLAPSWASFLPATAATRLLLRPRRVALTQALLQFMGDILVYQAKGQRIRAAIEEQLSAEPTVLLAHSLGGIACVELLLSSASARQRVPLLITVGSQAGMLHEIGALSTLPVAAREGSKLPADFPPWLNIYDHNDLLSFRAAPLFSGCVRDLELDSVQPFPHAHSAYWRNDQVWEHILSAIAKPENIQFQLRSQG